MYTGREMVRVTQRGNNNVYCQGQFYRMDGLAGAEKKKDVT